MNLGMKAFPIVSFLFSNESFIVFPMTLNIKGVVNVKHNGSNNPATKIKVNTWNAQ